MDDTEGFYDPEQDGLGPDETTARDGNVHQLPTNGNGRVGDPIDEHPEPDADDQIEFEFEEPEKRQSFGTLIPPRIPVKLKMHAKGKTLGANDTRPDISTPVDRVTEQVIERVIIDYTRDKDTLEIVSAAVTYNYATRGVWNATSEAARVALGLADPETAA